MGEQRHLTSDHLISVEIGGLGLVVRYQPRHAVVSAYPERESLLSQEPRDLLTVRQWSHKKIVVRMGVCLAVNFGVERLRTFLYLRGQSLSDNHSREWRI